MIDARLETYRQELISKTSIALLRARRSGQHGFVLGSLADQLGFAIAMVSAETGMPAAELLDGLTQGVFEAATRWTPMAQAAAASMPKAPPPGGAP